MADKILLFFNRGSGSFWHFWSDAASQPSQMPVTLWRGAEEDSSCRLTPLYSLIMKWANVIGFAVCLGILWGQLILAIWRFRMRFTRHQFSSVPELCLTLCDPKDCNTSGLPIHHQLLEFTQIHVHWVGDAIQPSHPLSSPSPPTLNLSQHQGLFKWVSSSHQVAKGLEFQLQHQSFQWIFRTGLVGSPCSPRDSQESSPTPQFKSTNSLVLSLKNFFFF